MNNLITIITLAYNSGDLVQSINDAITKNIGVFS